MKKKISRGMDTISNYVAGFVLWYGVNINGATAITSFSSITWESPTSVLDYYYNYKSLKLYGGSGDILSGVWW